MKKLSVNHDFVGIRLDKFLLKHNISFALAQKLIRQKQIKVNDKKVPAAHRLCLGDNVEIYADLLTAALSHGIKTKKSSPEILKKIKEAIIFQDKNLIAINKPQGLAVQGGSSISFSVDDALSFLKFDLEETPKLVHRLDKDTSGVLLIARNRTSADLLTDAFRNKTISKVYLALVKGVPGKMEGKIDIALAKKYHGNEEKVYPDKEGKEAITYYKVLKSNPDLNCSLLELRPITGRTHQLRVHCKEIGHPIIGDGKYGGKSAFIEKLPDRLCLHAWHIKMDDFFGEKLEIKTEKPSFCKII
jgi:23S rRNA pseudouridine955/2504/2580 synthase